MEVQYPSGAPAASYVYPTKEVETGSVPAVNSPRSLPAANAGADAPVSPHHILPPPAIPPARVPVLNSAAGASTSSSSSSTATAVMADPLAFQQQPLPTLHAPTAASADDSDGNLLMTPGCVFHSARTGNTYTMVERLGSGSFGMVVKCSVTRPVAGPPSTTMPGSGTGSVFDRPDSGFPTSLPSPFYSRQSRSSSSMTAAAGRCWEEGEGGVGGGGEGGGDAMLSGEGASAAHPLSMGAASLSRGSSDNAGRGGNISVGAAPSIASTAAAAAAASRAIAATSSGAASAAGIRAEPPLPPQPPEFVAVKVVRNHPAYYSQATMEIHILTLLKRQLPKKRGATAGSTTTTVGAATASLGEGGGTSPHATATLSDVPMVALLDHFNHASHLCLVFEYLPATLLEALSSNGYVGLPLPAVRAVMRQVREDSACVCTCAECE